MEIEDQILNLEQIQELQELGFNVEKYASMCWVKSFDDSENTNLNRILNKEYVEYMEISDFIPTMIIGDIIDVLPETIITKYCGRYIRSHIEINKKVVCYPCYDKNGEVSIMLFHSMQEIFIDSLFDCLVWCIKQKHIKI